MAKEKIQELEIPEGLTVSPEDLLFTAPLGDNQMPPESTQDPANDSVIITEGGHEGVGGDEDPANDSVIITTGDHEGVGGDEIPAEGGHKGVGGDEDQANTSVVFTEGTNGLPDFNNLSVIYETPDSEDDIPLTDTSVIITDDQTQPPAAPGKPAEVLSSSSASVDLDSEVIEAPFASVQVPDYDSDSDSDKTPDPELEGGFSHEGAVFTNMLSAISQQEERIKELKEENEGLRAKIEHEKELSSKAVESLKRDIEGVKAELEQTKESHNEYVSNSKAVMDGRLSTIQDLDIIAKKKDEEISNLKSKNAELEVNNNKFQELLNGMLEETATLKKELSYKDASIEALEQTIKQHQENFAQERQRNTELETKLTEAQASVSKLEAETKEPRAEPLTEDLKNKLSGFQRLSAGFDELEAQKNNLLQENQALKAQIQKFEELKIDNERLQAQLDERNAEAPVPVPAPAAPGAAPSANNDAPAPQPKGSWSNSVLNFLSEHKTQAGAGFGIALSATALYLGGGNPKDGLGQILSYSVDALKGIGSLLISAPMKLAEGIGSMLGRS